jgi:hypothetical protein
MALHRYTVIDHLMCLAIDRSFDSSSMGVPEIRGKGPIMGDQETTGQQPEEAPADDEQAGTVAPEDGTPSSPPSDPPTDGDGGDGGDVIFHG